MVELTALGDSISEDGFLRCCLSHLCCVGNSRSGGAILYGSLHCLHLCSDAIWYRRIGLPVSSFLLLLTGDGDGGPTVPHLDDSRQSTHRRYTGKVIKSAVDKLSYCIQNFKHTCFCTCCCFDLLSCINFWRLS